MDEVEYAELSFGGTTLRLDALGVDYPRDGLMVTSDAIEGWWDSPDLKVTQTERVTGDGAHDVPESLVLYAARTVTMHVAAVGATRDETLSSMGRLRSCMGRTVMLRVVDESDDTYVVGHASLKVDASGKWYRKYQVGTLTVVCPRPERLSTAERSGVMVPGASTTQGLVYSSGSDGVLQWPLSYGTAGAVRNVCTIENRGTHVAYPIIRASGDMPRGISLIDVSTGGQLSYGQPVVWQPVELDCRSRTVSVAGVDATRCLTARDWPSVPAGGSLTLALTAEGAGQVEITCHDTYI
jgi:hypothetical protein